MCWKGLMMSIENEIRAKEKSNYDWDRMVRDQRSWIIYFFFLLLSISMSRSNLFLCGLREKFMSLWNLCKFFVFSLAIFKNKKFKFRNPISCWLAIK
jgi:hypothetical protein